MNCFSGSAILFPLAEQLAEGVGAKIIGLQILLGGFMVTKISHDQDAPIGNTVHALIVDQGTGEVYSLYIRDINKRRKTRDIQPETETRVKNKSGRKERGEIKERNNPRKNDPVVHS